MTEGRTEIRRATESDLAAIEKIFKMSFHMRAAPNFSLYLRRENFLLMVAESDGKIVGFLLAQLDAKTGVAQILLLAVHPNHRRRGVGRKLIHEALRLFRNSGVRKVMLRVRTNNLIAKRFYERLGFRIRDLELNALRQIDGTICDLYLMEMDLSDRGGGFEDSRGRQGDGG